jgi:hypothetical protein
MRTVADEQRERMALPSRLFLGAVLAGHALMLLAIHARQGILLDKEALKYIGGAERLLAGALGGMTWHDLPYASYMLFLAPFVAMGHPEWAVAAQVALGLAAAWSLRGVVHALGGRRLQADLAFATQLLLCPVQTWTLALYSESFFTSVSLLFMASLLNTRGSRWPPLLLALVVLFTRPVGMLFVGPGLVWWHSRRRGSPAVRNAWAAALAVLCGLLVLPVLDPGLLGIVAEGHVIGGFPQWPGNGSRFSGTTLAAAQLQVLREHGALAWTWTIARRIGWLFAAVRPYWSLPHNLMMAPVWLLYPFALRAMVRLRADPAVGLLMVVLTLNAALVGLFFAEWNGRFVVPLLPLLIALAVVGVSRMAPSPSAQQADARP